MKPEFTLDRRVKKNLKIKKYVAGYVTFFPLNVLNFISLPLTLSALLHARAPKWNSGQPLMYVSLSVTLNMYVSVVQTACQCRTSPLIGYLQLHEIRPELNKLIL
jgi:hypothetical protein